MSKKYLSLEEAAKMLGIPQEELVRLREKQEIRGFADRGTWKFKHEDIESLMRRRQADSDPEVPLMEDFPQAPSVPMAGEKDLEEQPTIIRRGASGSDESIHQSEPDSTSPSDSDVRLIGGDEHLDLDFNLEGDSDVKLVGLGASISDNLGTDPEIVIKKPGSDSDVRLVRDDSDSDVKLAPDSDSDVKLVDGATVQDLDLNDVAEGGTDQDIPQRKPIELSNSDSDVRLIADDDLGATIADVGLIDDDDDQPIAIDFGQKDQSSILDEESGITLGHDSALLLGESGISLAGPSDSGIALELNDDDSGISLALDDESGISLDLGESGISLDSGESGISLASDDHGGTIPMMDILDDDDTGETQFEVAAIDDDSFDDLGATGVMDTLDDSASDAVFDLDDDAEVAEAFGEGDVDLDAGEYEDDLDVFGADEAAFEDAGVEAYGAPVVSRAKNVEAEWGTGTFVGLVLGSLLMLLCGVVMVDLVKNTASASSLNPVSGKVLEMLGGLYK